MNCPYKPKFINVITHGYIFYICIYRGEVADIN